MKCAALAVLALAVAASGAQANGYARTQRVFVQRQAVYAAPVVQQQFAPSCDVGCYAPVQQQVFAAPPVYAPPVQQVVQRQVFVQRQFVPVYQPAAVSFSSVNVSVGRSFGFRSRSFSRQSFGGFRSRTVIRERGFFR